MLEQMRNSSGSLITYMLFSMIIIVFVFTFGAVDPSEACRGGSLIEVATIGDTKVDETHLRMAGRLIPDFPAPRSRNDRATADRIVYRQFRYPYSPLSGKYVNRSRVCGFNCIDFGMRPGLAAFSLNPREIPMIKPKKILEHLVETVLVSNAATQLGIVVSNDELRDRVRPQFLDAKTKAFDKDGWKDHIRRSGVGAGQYEGFLRRELQREKLLALTLAGLVISDYELGFYQRLTGEKVRVEFISIDDDTAQSMLVISDDDLTKWLADKAHMEKATKHYVKRAKTYTKPQRYAFQSAYVEAESKAVIAAEKDPAKKAAMEAARKAKADEANKLAANKPVEDGESSFTKSESTLAEAKASMGASVSEALKALKAGDPGKVVETELGFVVIHLDKVIEETKTPFTEVKTDIARELLSDEKTAEFKKMLADELHAAIKADGNKTLKDHVMALNTKYKAEGSLEVQDSGLVPRAFSNKTLYPHTTSLDQGHSIRQLGAMGTAGKSLALLKAAFVASTDTPLLPEVYEMFGTGNLVVAVLKERKEAESADEGVDELREKLLLDKEVVTYLSWYAKFREDKRVVRQAAFTQMVNQETQTWMESGGTVAGQRLPLTPVAPVTPQI